MSRETLLPAGQLPAEIAQLLTPELPPLGPGRPIAALADSLARVDPARWADNAGPLSPAAADCCRAGLWLWNGFLERSHRLSQAVPTAEGSWWHGIMHRREPDPGNAKYWFRQVGDHPLAQPLADRIRQHLAVAEVPPPAAWLIRVPRWDAFRFVDLCEQARHSGGHLEAVAREVAAIEWYALLTFCRTGGSIAAI